MGLYYQQDHTRPFSPCGLWSKAGHVCPFSPSSFGLFACLWPGLLLASQHDLPWVSWDHQSCCATLGHQPPLSHPLHSTEFQLPSVCQALCLPTDRITFTVNLKRQLVFSLWDTPHILLNLVKNLKHMATNTIHSRLKNVLLLCQHVRKEVLEMQKMISQFKAVPNFLQNHCVLKIRV